MDVKAIIEALRGGNVPADQRGPAGRVRRYPDGQIVKNPGPLPRSQPMPTKLRGYQLHNAEAAAEGTAGSTYAEWSKDN